MTDVLGKHLSRAVHILEKEGYTVETEELQSNKIDKFDTYLVVRQRLLGSKVELLYSKFKQEI